MALQGSFYGTTANSRIVPQITWTAAPSPEGNYSDITATLTYSRTNSGYTTGGTWEGSLTIGDQVFTGSRYIEVTYQSDTVALTATARVSHDAYGQLSVTIRAEGGIVKPADASLKNTEISGVAVVDAIVLSSSVSAADGNIGSRVTVVVSRKKEGSRHSIFYSFGGLGGYIDREGNPTDEETLLTETVLNFLLPEQFYQEIPGAPSALCSLTCRTYDGAELVGQPQKTQFRVTAANCQPLLTAELTADEKTAALTGSLHKLIRFASTAHCLASATAQRSAYIETVTINGVEGNGYETISGISQPTVEVSATDSRGYTTSVTLKPDYVPYVPLSLTAAAQRTDPTSGNAVVTVWGSCWKGDFGAAENRLQLQLQTGDQSLIYEIPLSDDHTYRAELPLSGLDYTCAHTIAVTAADRVMEVTGTATVNRGLPVFDWGSEDFRFRVPVELPALTLGGIPLAQYILNIQGESQ